jgi:hypothetical protein
MLVMARVTIRKTLKGELLEERIEPLPDDPRPEVAFLGKLYAEKLSKYPHFIEFCDNYRKEHNIA